MSTACPEDADKCRQNCGNCKLYTANRNDMDKRAALTPTLANHPDVNTCQHRFAGAGVWPWKMAVPWLAHLWDCGLPRCVGVMLAGL